MKRAISLLALALLAGCASLVPDYERPDAPVAGSFAGAEAADLEPGVPAAADIHWREFFRDERLRRLIEIALDENRDLRTAMLGIERARALYGVSRADLYPTIGIGANRTRQPGPSGATADVYSVGFALSTWEIDFFGRVRSLNEAALSRYLASEEARNALQTSLVAAVANSYLNLLAGDELIAVTRQALKTREESARLTKLMYDNGVVSELDLHQAQSLLESARASLAQLTRQRAIDENALVALIGRPLPADLPPGLSLQRDGHLLSALPAGLPSEVLVRRPDVREAELQLIAANANIGAARAAFFPRITLTATAGTASDELSGLFDGGSGAWTFAAQLLQPLFDAGRNRANLRISRVDREIAVARYEQVIQDGFREVSDALAGRATFGEQLRAEQALADAEQARLRLSELRYRSGTASYLEVLDAQRSLLAAQQAIARTRAAQLQNQVALYRALGGGWYDDARQPAEGVASADGAASTDGAASSEGAAPTAGAANPASATSSPAASAPRAPLAKRPAARTGGTGGTRAQTATQRAPKAASASQGVVRQPATAGAKRRGGAVAKTPVRTTAKSAGTMARKP